MRIDILSKKYKHTVIIDGDSFEFEVFEIYTKSRILKKAKWVSDEI